MKKLIILLLLSGNFSYGQTMVVYDAVNSKLNMAVKLLTKQNLKLTAENQGILQETLRLNQEWEEALTVVSSAIANNQKVIDIFSLEVQIINHFNHSVKILHQDVNFEYNDVVYLEKIYVLILEENYNNLNDLLDIINPGLRMSDGERLKFIQDILAKQTTITEVLTMHDNRIQKISNDRARHSQNSSDVNALNK